MAEMAADRTDIQCWIQGKLEDAGTVFRDHLSLRGSSRC